MKILLGLTFIGTLFLLTGCDSTTSANTSAVSTEGKEMIIPGDQAVAWNFDTIDTSELQTALVFDIDNESAVASVDN